MFTEEEFTPGDWCFLSVTVLFSLLLSASVQLLLLLLARCLPLLSLNPSLYQHYFLQLTQCIVSLLVISLGSLAVSGSILNHAGAALVPQHAFSKMLLWAFMCGSIYSGYTQEPQNWNIHAAAYVAYTCIQCARTHTHTCKNSYTRETVFHCTWVISMPPLWLSVVMIFLIEVNPLPAKWRKWIRSLYPLQAWWFFL